jgi:hypothetical protein
MPEIELQDIAPVGRKLGGPLFEAYRPMADLQPLSSGFDYRSNT